MVEAQKRKLNINIEDERNNYYVLEKRSRTDNNTLQSEFQSTSSNNETTFLAETEIQKIKEKLNILIIKSDIEIDEVYFEKLYAKLNRYTKPGSFALQQLLQCDILTFLTVF
jgi:hypothetical protein